MKHINLKESKVSNRYSLGMELYGRASARL